MKVIGMYDHFVLKTFPAHIWLLLFVVLFLSFRQMFGRIAPRCYSIDYVHSSVAIFIISILIGLRRCLMSGLWFWLT
jgi:hypothetical protein